MQPDNDNVSALASILSEVAGVDPDKVTAASTFAEELDLDSLTMVEVGVALEERLGVHIADEDAEHLVTVGDMAALIERARTAA